MNNEIVKRALIAYQHHLYKEIEYYGILGNEILKQGLLQEVWLVEDEIEALKKSNDIVKINEA